MFASILLFAGLLFLVYNVNDVLSGVEEIEKQMRALAIAPLTLIVAAAVAHYIGLFGL